MFFSRFQFNPVRRGAQKLLGSPHALHAAVLAGFPDPSPSENGRVLWRLDNSAHVAKLFIVSPTKPDLTHLAEQAGWPSLDDSWGSTPYDKLLDRIEKGQTYRFRLTANPVHSERRPDGQRGKVYAHVTVAQQEKWLLDKQERHGFAIAASDAGLDLVVRDRKTLTFHRRETNVTLSVASYEGTLTVTDRDEFVSALCLGIGRAKGYGCGLLTIAPAS